MGRSKKECMQEMGVSKGALRKSLHTKIGSSMSAPKLEKTSNAGRKQATPAFNFKKANRSR